MQAEKLVRIVMAIREQAINKNFDIRRVTDTTNWENRILNLISDEVVYTHLTLLQPFQLTRGNDITQVYEFQINYYRYNVYLKVNLKQLEVLSFHCAETSTSTVLDSYHYKTNENDATAVFTDIAVIPEATSFGRRGWICRFAIGSQVITVPVHPTNIQNDNATIALQDYYDAIQSVANEFHQQYLMRVINRARLQNYGIALCDPADVVQLANIGFDLYNDFPSLYHSQDMAVDLILQIPPQEMESVREYLQVPTHALPNLPASLETLAEDHATNYKLSTMN